MVFQKYFSEYGIKILPYYNINGICVIKDFVFVTVNHMLHFFTKKMLYACSK